MDQPLNADKNPVSVPSPPEEPAPPSNDPDCQTPLAASEEGNTEARNAALRLHMVAGVGDKIFAELISHFGSASAVLNGTPQELREVPGVGEKLVREIVMASDKIAIEPVLELCQQNDIRIIDATHDQFPPSLKEIYDPPPILFVKGRLEPIDSIAVAIVGARHATHYGRTVAEKLANGLAHAGFTIVSGLARGIDAASHRGALKAGGRTIAVLGGGLLKMYPPEHAGLADEIMHQGAVISEALPRVAPKAGCFPKRNRIISGLSLGLIVVEAGDRSGALISARLAMEQNREVFAVPGRIDSRMSRGCHRLIRDGAHLLESVEDVLEALGPLAQPTVVDATTTVHHPAELRLTEQETLVLNAISQDPTEFDVVVVETGLPPARVLATISVLEIRRLIRRTSGTAFVRI